MTDSASNAPNDITFADVTRTFVRADGQMVTAVDGFSAHIREGEFVCLVGPSGCGKTTLLQMASGLLPTSSGSITIGATEVKGPGPDRGVVFQKDSVFPWFRVIDNVEYGMKRRGVPAAERRDIADRYLELVGLSHVAQAWPKELSGGMMKRVAIATVFANGSDVLLLDEPFAALDYVTKYQLHDVLLDLWRRADAARRTVLFVTHDVDESLILADRIIVISGGRLVDDIAIAAERPRDVDTLTLPEIMAVKHKLLAHLGLEHGPQRGAAA